MGEAAPRARPEAVTRGSGGKRRQRKTSFLDAELLEQFECSSENYSAGIGDVCQDKGIRFTKWPFHLVRRHLDHWRYGRNIVGHPPANARSIIT